MFEGWLTSCWRRWLLEAKNCDGASCRIDGQQRAAEKHAKSSNLRGTPEWKEERMQILKERSGG
eukprot:CAMPEP_0206603306 /NCGR_PEP_ID=MMETSP0325_2-20121206/48245_1 /ASSEMBLY_ACC=CAM_ASM_000347 /TAXON_ID=2866 /ORGANISM="Crypthecodinium cohnii, Strain Seligo" /LENGTH=63 /DNA_ID=CAMNT_0054116641 /DNA_START=18 /DNA_END=205 /DNA_ORIENTATION=+